MGSIVVGPNSWHAPTSGGPATLQPRVQSSDISYLGYFYLPMTDLPGGAESGDSVHWLHGSDAAALAVSGSDIYVSGHTYNKRIAKLTMPSLGGTATTSVSLTPVPYNVVVPEHMNDGDGQDICGGVFWNSRFIYAAKRYYSWRADYSTYLNVASLNSSLSDAPASLSKITGPYLSERAYVGSFGIVPTEWRSLLGGPILTGGNYQPGNQDWSNGPSAFTFDPDAVVPGATVTASPLLYYEYPDHIMGYPWGGHEWDPPPPGPFSVFTMADKMGGIVFPSGSRSVLYVHSHGTGIYKYGIATSNPALDGVFDPGTGKYWCYDPDKTDDGGPGTHAWPYVVQITAYDANDLLDVKNGGQNVYAPRPYATWTLSQFNSNSAYNICMGGVSYDPSNRRFYIMQGTGYSKRLVHVYQVANFG